MSTLTFKSGYKANSILEKKKKQQMKKIIYIMKYVDSLNKDFTKSIFCTVKRHKNIQEHHENKQQ